MSLVSAVPLALATLALSCVVATAQPVLSEWSATASTALADEDGDDSDWIEIANPTGEPVDMSGYCLTDDPDIVAKWRFPPGVTLAPAGYLLVFASGKDRALAGSPLHANFRLSAGGEYLALLEPDGITVTHAITPAYPRQVDGATFGSGMAAQAEIVTFLTPGSEARWLVPDSPDAAAADWQSPGYSDDAWTPAQTGIGYQFDGLVGAGGDVSAAMRGINASIFVRMPFAVASPAAVTSMTLRLRYEDGFVAWLNGKQVAAANAPATPPTPDWDATSTRVRSDEEAVIPEEFPVDFGSALVSGTNVLAFHGLNSSRGGSDFLLLPELGGTMVDLSQPATLGYFEHPTPGGPNAPLAFTEIVDDTRFSIDRGFHEEPIEVEITSGTPGARIHFTTDGTVPTEATGTLYTAPLLVTTTTTLRATAFADGMHPSNTATQTYLFLNDVIRQPALPEGAPARWGSRPADYEMDPDVVDDPAYSGRMIDALKSIRSLSIVVDPDDFWNSPRGIYASPQNDGNAWERPVSLEFLDPADATASVQANAGIRIHGNGSRSANGQPKHSFRVEFRGAYGDATLRYPLFPGSKVAEFDSLILRAQNAHGWTRASQIANGAGTEREQSQYIRDAFARDLMRHMGHTAGAATYVHLYINGLYWGLYNPVEYPRTYFGKSHFGGEEEDYDVINRRTTTTKLLDGTWEAWRDMQALASSGLDTPGKYAQIQRHIDVDNLIDYMLMHQYMGSRDGPEVFNSNNMRAIRRSRGGQPKPWIAMPWDMEASMFEIDVTRNVNVDDPDTLVRVYTRLRENKEFRLRYADRVQRHCFRGGPLSPQGAAAIWETRAREISLAIIGESARWGDYRRPGRPFTRDGEWQAERERLLATYFPTRSGFLVDLLRRNGLYPELDAPVFNSDGPVVEPGFELSMTSTAGAIYFTTDGSDPRLPGGAISGSATMISGGTVDSVLIPRNAQWRYLDDGSDQQSAWRGNAFDDSGWKSGMAELGYGDRDEETLLGFGDPARKFTTYYFRRAFTIAPGVVISGLQMELVRDDGAVVYLNGSEVFRDNLPEGEITSATLATDSISGAGESDFLTVSLDPSVLVAGNNVLAVEIHQDHPAGSDVSFNASLTATQAVGDAFALPVTTATKVKARSHDGDAWSALSEATLTPPPVPANAGNLVISEMHYHPAAGGEEFLELMNISATDTVDLQGVAFTDGVAFTFDQPGLLFPGQRVVIRQNQFHKGTSLSNAGETVTLASASGAVLRAFTYADGFPWPEGADGFGFSIVLAHPQSNPDHSNPRNWRRGTRRGGTPGEADPATAFQGDPGADNDRDGVTALVEFALGSSDADAGDASALHISRDAHGNTIARFPINAEAVDLLVQLEMSPDLSTWSPPADAELISIDGDEGARHVDSWRIVQSIANPGLAPQYLRLKIDRLH